MIEKLAEYIKDKDKNYTILDIGARDCLQSIELYRLFSNSRIYAFECNPNTIDVCKNNIQLFNDRISLFNFAISNFDGYTKFYPINPLKTRTSWIDGNPGASSLFKANGTYPIENYVQDEIEVECRRLDSIIEEYRLDMPDIIWMDLQGAEMLALQGLGKYLQNIKYIHTEVSHRPIYHGQVMFDELDNFLKINNFTHHTKINTNAWQQDIIYYRQ